MFDEKQLDAYRVGNLPSISHNVNSRQHMEEEFSACVTDVLTKVPVYFQSRGCGK